MEPQDSRMVPITKWEDVEPFAGKIVAYTTNNNYFLSKNGYSFDESEVKYGYISKSKNLWKVSEDFYSCNDTTQMGHVLRQLIRSDSQRNCVIPLIDWHLKGSQMAMRNADLAEIIRIKRSDAKFACTCEVIGRIMQAELENNHIEDLEFYKLKIR